MTMVIVEKSVERFLNSCQFFDTFWTVAGFDKRWERREGRLKGWGFLFSCFSDLFCAILFQKLRILNGSEVLIKSPHEAGLNSRAWGSQGKIHSHCGLLQVVTKIIILAIISSLSSQRSNVGAWSRCPPRHCCWSSRSPRLCPQVVTLCYWAASIFEPS